MHATVHSRHCSCTVAVYYSQFTVAVFLFIKKNFPCLLDFAIHGNMQELYFIKYLLVIHTKNDHGFSLNFMVCNNN